MMRVLLCVSVLVFTLAAARAERLIFEDNFDNFDMSKWDHEVTMWGGGNGEFQTYTQDPTNSYVRDGTLFLKPTLTRNNINPLTGQPFGEAFLYNGVMDLYQMYGRCTNSNNYGCHREGRYGILPPTMSARIRTKERFSYKFGRLEIVAKMPVGDWLWPALWLLPESNVYGGWPKSGEIDLAESRGNRDLRTSAGYIGIQKIGSTLHWGPRYDVNKFYLTSAGKLNESSNYGDNFHKYVISWDANGFRVSIDDDEFALFPDPPINVNPDWNGFWDFGMKNGGMGGLPNPWAGGTLMAPFDQNFHILLNVAVGGTNGYFPDNAINGNGPKPWSNTGEGNKMQHFYNQNQVWYPTWDENGEHDAMQIKYVRVYQ